MEKIIYKYEISQEATRQTLNLPINSTILKVTVKEDTVYLYALIPMNEIKSEDRVIKIYGTWWRIPSHSGELIYLDSVHVGQYVWHLFEETANANPKD